MMFYWFLKYFEVMKKHCGQKKSEISHASQILTHEPQILVLSNSSNYYCKLKRKEEHCNGPGMDKRHHSAL